MNVDDLIKTAVDDAVREVPPGFADGAIRRAHRARRRTRLAAAGAAVLVAAVAVAQAGPAGPRTDAPPADGGDVDVVDLGALPAGAVPQVAWYADGALHVGSASTPTDTVWDEQADRPVIERASGGYVVWTWRSDPDDPYGRSTLTLVPDEGEPIVLADGHVTPAVVSPDGGRIAWGLPNRDWVTDEQARADGLTSAVVVADGNGRVVAQLPDAPSPGATPKGFLADGGLVVEGAANVSWGVYLWEPGGGITLLREDAGADAVSPSGDLAVLSGGAPGAVTDLATGTTLWRPGGGHLPRFSPDGRYLAMVEPRDGVERADDVLILDARTGTEVARFAFRSADGLRWESPAEVVVEAHDDTGAALVRCTVDGGCELGTEVRPADPDPDAFDHPYVLG